MIVAQSRGLEFSRSDSGMWWSTCDFDEENYVWKDMDETFGMSSGDVEAGTAYGLALTGEGKAFRQRFVDYVPPEEATHD